MITREQATATLADFEAAGLDGRIPDLARTVVALHDENATIIANAQRITSLYAEERDVACAEVERLRAEIAKLPATVDQTVNLLRLAEASVSLLRADIADRERERERLQNMIWAANGVLSDNGCDCDCEHHWEEHEPDCERCLACRIDNAMRAAVPGSV